MHLVLLIIPLIVVVLLIGFIIVEAVDSPAPLKPYIEPAISSSIFYPPSPPTGESDTEKIEPAGGARVPIVQLEKYIEGAVIDRYTLNLLNEATLGNKKSVSIPDSVLSELEFKRKQYFEKELAFDRLYTLRATSQVLEMGGRFEEAFESYKETIIFAVTSRDIPLNAYLLDINRFRFLCNKLKRKKEYENVIARYKIPV